MVLKFDTSNTKNPKYDMSKSESRIYDMLLYITKQGRPISAWEVHKKLNKNQPTVHNIFKQLESEQLIAKFEFRSRNKIEYGPTWGGLVELCNLNNGMINEVKNIVNVWLDVPKFVKILVKDFGEDFEKLVTEKPDDAKEVLKDWILYHHAVVKEGEEAYESPAWFFYRIMIGEMELRRKHPKEWLVVTKIFFDYVKVYRENIKQGMHASKEFNEKFAQFEAESTKNN